MTAIGVADVVLAKIAARAAATTPGVVRLQPPTTRALGRAATNLVSRAASAAVGHAATAAGTEHDAVDVSHVADVVSVTIRLVLASEPAVIDTAESVLGKVAADLTHLAGRPAQVHLQIVDVEPAG